LEPFQNPISKIETWIWSLITPMKLNQIEMQIHHLVEDVWILGQILLRFAPPNHCLNGWDPSFGQFVSLFFKWT
jgi:hypothetical protein